MSVCPCECVYSPDFPGLDLGPRSWALGKTNRYLGCNSSHLGKAGNLGRGSNTCHAPLSIEESCLVCGVMRALPPFLLCVLWGGWQGGESPGHEGRAGLGTGPCRRGEAGGWMLGGQRRARFLHSQWAWPRNSSPRLPAVSRWQARAGG